MADLMTGAYTFRELDKKYDHFFVPLIRVKYNGMDLVSAMKLDVLECEIRLSLEAAGMAVLKLGGLYNDEKHSFEKKAKNRLALGTILEVELGYASSALKVFKGFIAMVGAEFGNLPLLVVTLMDVRRLMMQSGDRHMLHEVKNYSDAFKTVMASYSGICSVKIDPTQDSLEKPLSQTENDYLFVTNELIRNGRTDREFFVVGDTAYFREPRKVEKPVMTMKFGRELFALKMDEEYRNLAIEVIGYDADAQAVLTGKATVKKNAKQKSLMSSTPVFTVTDPSADTAKRASAKAKMLADERAYAARTGRGLTIGLPELVPGRYVEVEDLEKDFGDHVYYITDVSHVIRNGEFRTTFEIGGWR